MEVRFSGRQQAQIKTLISQTVLINNPILHMKLHHEKEIHFTISLP
jgi:hypothetical protein